MSLELAQAHLAARFSREDAAFLVDMAGEIQSGLRTSLEDDRRLMEAAPRLSTALEKVNQLFTELGPPVATWPDDFKVRYPRFALDVAIFASFFRKVVAYASEDDEPRKWSIHWSRWERRFASAAVGGAAKQRGLSLDHNDLVALVILAGVEQPASENHTKESARKLAADSQRDRWRKELDAVMRHRESESDRDETPSTGN